MLPVTQIDTFYNGLTLRHRDTINAAVGETFMKRRPKECYDLIENMTAHHNDRDTSAQRNESSSSITSSNPEIAALKLQMEEMNRNLTRMLQTNQQVNSSLSNKEKLIELPNTPVSEICSTVILKKLPKKLGDLGKFLIPCGFNELKCKALADLGASINLMPISVWKELGLPKLISTQMTLELANRDICTPKGIARDVFVPVGKFTFPADFVIVDYKSDPHVPLILRRPILRTTRALIDVHGEEMILRDDLFAQIYLRWNSTFSFLSSSDLTSLEVNDDIFDPEEDIIENLLNLDKTKDLPLYHDNQLSNNPTLISEPETKSSSSSPTLISLEERCPGFLKPLMLAVFVLRSQELHILSFILGNQYPNLIE
ncbi:reverse transcriptase domain-containing protein [Tanacetum coccineum]